MQAFGLNSVKTDKLGEQIGRELMRAIVDGHFRTGERLPSENELAHLFNRSRIAVRDALHQLAILGIVTTRQGQGTTVNPIGMWNTLDPDVFVVLYGEQAFDQLLEMRRIIEPEAAYLAAQRITDEQIGILRPLSVLLESDSIDQHVERDTSFHLEIARAAQNSVLLTMISSISVLLRESRRCTYAVPGEISNGHMWHQTIFTAIETRDAEGARKAMSGHLDQVGLALVRWQAEHPRQL